MTITIRRPEIPAEVGELTATWKRAVEATHHFLSAADIATLEAEVRFEYLPGADDLWVAVDADDQPQAFLGLSGSHIDALFVHPDAHGTGIGSALIAFAGDRHPVLTVDVNEQNPLACEFYRRRGFRDVGRSPVDDQGRPFPILHLRR